MRTILIYIFIFYVSLIASGQDSTDYNSLFSMSIEDLVNIKVTSATKKKEILKKVPSSIYVITAKDISQSSATTLKDLLQTIPGFWLTSNDYKYVSALSRNHYESSVLYLVDGTPLQDLMTSNFQFGNFDIPLSEIDRIECIKGSGGSIYGANSATGVVSIFTKSPEEYDGVHTNLKVAAPLFTDLDLSAGIKINDKMNLGFYGKLQYFNGYEQIPEVTNSDYQYTSSAPTEKTTTITNRYTEDDNKRISYALGLKLNYQLSEKTDLSTRIHFNKAKQNVYSHYFIPESFYTLDTAYTLNTKPQRLVGNLKLEHRFNDKHNLFIRASSNKEYFNYSFGGGFAANNSMYDFEFQDNLEFRNQQISFGTNYRLISINIEDIVNKNQIDYNSSSTKEHLHGAFIQYQLRLFDENLVITTGVKTEKYSLINNNYYNNPTVKLLVTPTDKLTFWGGYSLSRTTPGFDNTNINLTIYRAPSYQNFSPAVTEAYKNATISSLISNGMDESTATTAAESFLTSPTAQNAIDSLTSIESDKYPGYYNVEVINGSNTEPTSFSTFELGIRTEFNDNFSFENNFFYSKMNGGIASSPNLQEFQQPSLTKEGEYSDVIYYGNYVNGITIGNEAIIRWIPTKKIRLECSYSWIKNELEYKKNNDFDIDLLTDDEKKNLNREVPNFPSHIVRIKASYTLPKNFTFTLDGLIASEFHNYFVTNKYKYDDQRYESLLATGVGKEVGYNANRLIVNLKFEKEIIENSLSIYIFGNDILSSPFIESTNAVNLVYPRQVGRMLGLGVSYTPNSKNY